MPSLVWDVVWRMLVVTYRRFVTTYLSDLQGSSSARRLWTSEEGLLHVKVKVKTVCGSYSTAALSHIVLLPEWVPSFISRGAAHTKRRERPLLAKEGTIPGIYLAIHNSRKLLDSLICRKAGTWDRFFYFPSGGRHADDFYYRKNPTASTGFEPTNLGARGQHVNH